MMMTVSLAFFALSNSASAVVTYAEYQGLNTYAGAGASANLDGNEPVIGLTASECKERCTEDAACDCVVFEPENGADSWCLKRTECVASGFTHNAGHDVYVKVSYTKYPNRNCYAGKGAYADLDDNTPEIGLTAAQCAERCTADAACDCVVFEPENGADSWCLKRTECVASGFTHNGGHDVYVKASTTSPTVLTQALSLPESIGNLKAKAVIFEGGSFGAGSQSQSLQMSYQQLGPGDEVLSTVAKQSTSERTPPTVAVSRVPTSVYGAMLNQHVASVNLALAGVVLATALAAAQLFTRALFPGRLGQPLLQ